MYTAQMKARATALLVALGITLSTAANAQGQVNKYGNPLTHPPKPTTAAITPEELRTRLYIFADDSMQGRQVATVGNMKGTAYIANELKRVGVEPGGDNGGYFQRLPYVHRKFGGTPSLTVGGSPLVYLTDFVPVPGARAPKSVANVAVIFGGVLGDSARMITAEQAAGKVVVLSIAAPGAAGGRAGGNPAAAGNAPSLPAACTAAAAGRGGAGGGGGGRGGANVPSNANVIAATARFPNAIAVATVDLDALSPAQRIAIGVPLTAEQCRRWPRRCG